MSDETYVAGLRELLGDFRPRSMLILDATHPPPPASGSRYAIDSRFRMPSQLAGRFERRLFLSATPHNGHSNSFSALLEILDPQRFTAGIPSSRRPDPIMVRRLESDRSHLGTKFPERKVKPIVIRGLPPDAPELALARLLAKYGDALWACSVEMSAREAVS